MPQQIVQPQFLRRVGASPERREIGRRLVGRQQPSTRSARGLHSRARGVSRDGRQVARMTRENLSGLGRETGEFSQNFGGPGRTTITACSSDDD